MVRFWSRVLSYVILFLGDKLKEICGKLVVFIKVRNLFVYMNKSRKLIGRNKNFVWNSFVLFFMVNLYELEK